MPRSVLKSYARRLNMNCHYSPTVVPWLIEPHPRYRPPTTLRIDGEEVPVINGVATVTRCQWAAPLPPGIEDDEPAAQD